MQQRGGVQPARSAGSDAGEPRRRVGEPGDVRGVAQQEPALEVDDDRERPAQPVQLVRADGRGGPGFGGDDGGQQVGRVQRREHGVGVGREVGGELRVEVPARAARDLGDGGGAASAGVCETCSARCTIRAASESCSPDAPRACRARPSAPTRRRARPRPPGAGPAAGRARG